MRTDPASSNVRAREQPTPMPSLPQSFLFGREVSQGRLEREALRVGYFLQSHPGIRTLRFPGLDFSPYMTSGNETQELGPFYEDVVAFLFIALRMNVSQA